MKHGCVVIADIHQNMLEGIRGLMDAVFETVVMVASMESLLEATSKLKPKLVILDVSMPCPGECNVVQEFINQYRGTKLIVLSVHDEANVADKIIKLGAAGFVLKRRAATDLIPAVEEVLKGQTYISRINQKDN